MLPIVSAIANRHSTRKFHQTPVEPDAIESMLEAARLAPAACNISHFRVLVIDQPEDLAVVRKAAYSMGAINEAPLVLLHMADTSLDAPFVKQMDDMAKMPNPPVNLSVLRSGTGNPFALKVGRDWALVNAAICGEHMMLQAVELGLAGCWVHHFDHDEVRAHFAIPPHMEFISLMAIGHAAEQPPASAGRGNIRYEVVRA
jgi:nitroreductase